jgi:hypothetical protein
MTQPHPINTDERTVTILADEIFAFSSMLALGVIIQGVPASQAIGVKIISDSLLKKIEPAVGTGVWPIKIQMPVYQLYLIAFPVKQIAAPQPSGPIDAKTAKTNADMKHTYVVIREAVGKMGYDLDRIMQGDIPRAEG